MTMLEAFVKERNEALFSLDRKKIEAYMIKYGETEIAQTPDVVFWASVYKAICGIKDAPEAIVSKAKAWLHEHGMSPYDLINDGYIRGLKIGNAFRIPKVNVIEYVMDQGKSAI